MLRDPAWFVSYAWRDDTSPAGLMREQRVDQACEAARELGVVIWDVKTGYLVSIQKLKFLELLIQSRFC